MVRKPKTVNKSITIAATATGASATVLYTCPTRFIAEVTLLTVMNPTAGSLDVTVEIYDSKSTNYYTIADVHAVNSKNMLQIVNSGTKLYLDEGDKIVASASSANQLKIYTSLVENYSEVTR